MWDAIREPLYSIDPVKEVKSESLYLFGLYQYQWPVNHMMTDGIPLIPLYPQLGFPPDGTTGYYSSNCVKSDAEIVQAFMDAKGISG